MEHILFGRVSYKAKKLQLIERLNLQPGSCSLVVLAFALLQPVTKPKIRVTMSQIQNYGRIPTGSSGRPALPFHLPVASEPPIWVSSLSSACELVNVVSSSPDATATLGSVQGAVTIQMLDWLDGNSRRSWSIKRIVVFRRSGADNNESS